MPQITEMQIMGPDTMTIIPIIGLIVAAVMFRKKFILTDEKLQEINDQLHRESEKE